MCHCCGTERFGQQWVKLRMRCTNPDSSFRRKLRLKISRKNSRFSPANPVHSPSLGSPLPAYQRSPMQPIHDTDVLLLLSLAFSSKRRPAELIEIVAAAEIVQGVIPANVRLIESFSRLSQCGLI